MNYKMIIFYSILPVVVFSSDHTNSTPVNKDRVIMTEQNSSNNQEEDRPLPIDFSVIFASLKEYEAIMFRTFDMVEKLSGRLKKIEEKQNSLKLRFYALKKEKKESED